MRQCGSERNEQVKFADGQWQHEFMLQTKIGDGSRYDTAMKSLDDFLTYRKGDAFGLTFFGNNTLHWVPLTSDVSAIRCSPPRTSSSR